ncbi:uncharacterized protein [Zea mays]|uniref:uncharacterized protein n=1 Tax=Zea mays TaxID=4577 RepID=UPI0009A9C2C6|nr:uncharacterized protein LOC109944171 [Zea mays]|eukprot:XP_020404435.1 uncharacterized protein LOC109944171 [Zea mays]
MPWIYPNLGCSGFSINTDPSPLPLVILHSHPSTFSSRHSLLPPLPTRTALFFPVHGAEKSPSRAAALHAPLGHHGALLPTPCWRAAAPWRPDFFFQERASSLQVASSLLPGRRAPCSPAPRARTHLPAPFFPLALAPCRRAARPLPPCAAALPTPPWSAQGPSDPSSSSELTVAHGAPTPCYTFSRPPLPSAPFSLLAVDVGALSKTASFQRPLHLLWKTASPHGVLVFSLLDLASRARCRDTLAAAPPRALPARRYAQPTACCLACVVRSPARLFSVLSNCRCGALCRGQHRQLLFWRAAQSVLSRCAS